MVSKEYWVERIKDWIEGDFPDILEREQNIPLEIPIARTISLIGPRRAGKTYEMLILAREVSEKFGKDKTFYINLERADLGVLNSSDLMGILDAYIELYPDNKKEELWLFLDEIQNVAGWELFVRNCLDQKIKVYITGSSSKLLSTEIATSMRGRNLSYNIFPLSFKEFLRFKSFNYQSNLSSKEKAKVLNYFKEYLNFGGYPEVALFPEEKERILQDIFNTAVLKDIVDRHKIRNDNLLKSLVKALLTSKEFSTNKFYNYLKSIQIKSSKDSVYKYTSYFEDAFFVFFLNKFDTSYKKSEQTLPKVYFIDNGFLKINSIDDKGRLLENLVFIELLRRGKDVSYFQTPNKNEVDFVIKNRRKVKRLIQVCYDLSDFNTKDREIKSLLIASKEFNCHDLVILTNSKEDEIKVKGKKIKIIPVWKWVLEEK